MLKLFRFFLLPVIRWFYRIELRGSANIPREGGVLLAVNHGTFADAFLVSMLSERPVRFVIYQGFMKVRAIGWFIRLTGAIPITGKRPRDAIRATADAVNEGHVVCLFPEGQLSRSGLMSELRKGIDLIARQLKAPVVPVYMDGLWGSVFSFERDRFFFKWPRRIRHSVSVAIGEAIPADQVNSAILQQRLRQLSVEAFSARPELCRPLPGAILEALKRHPTRPLFIEHSRPGAGGKARRKVSRASAIAAAIALAARWKRSLPQGERRIGILLPGGAASAFMNLGLVLAGRVPVNLPFAGDPKQLAEQLDRLGIRTVMTSRAFAPVLEGFPWHGASDGTFVDLRGEIDAAGSVRMLLERARACLEPQWMARRRLGFDARPDTETAAQEAFGYLWREGHRNGDGNDDSGEWRTTFFSHFQLQAAVAQLFNGRMLAQRDEKIFCEQPMNEAIGALFSLWLPVLGDVLCLGRSAAARAEAGMIESVLSAESATLLVSSAELREQIEAGEEWHPAIAGHLQRILNFETALAASDNDGADRLERITGIPLFHGWAPGRCGGVASLSLPDLPALKTTQLDQPGGRDGSVGRLLPGIALSENSQPGGELELRVPSPKGGESCLSARSGTVDEAGFVFLDEAEPASDASNGGDSAS